MNLTLERDALHAALGRVAKLVERRATIPVLAHLHLDAAVGHLRIRGTDLDMEGATTILADVRQPGMTTAPAHLLADIVQRYPSGSQVTLSMDTGTMALVVRSGRSRLTLNVLDPADWPEAGGHEASHTFDLPAADLIRLFGKVEFAISNEETRYYLNGIYLHAMDIEGVAMLRAVATDGHRLARMEMPAPAGASGLAGVIVPKKAVAEIKRLAKDATGPVTLEIDTRRLVATIPGKVGITTLATKLIDGTFPDYLRVIPTGNDKPVVLDRVAVMAAAERVACISSERGRAVKLAFAADRLIFAVRQSEAGDAAEEMDINYRHAPLEVGFNAAYFGECLGTFETDTVRLDLADPGSPAVIRASGSEDLLLVLMPMRV